LIDYYQCAAKPTFEKVASIEKCIEAELKQSFIVFLTISLAVEDIKVKSAKYKNILVVGWLLWSGAHSKARAIFW